MRRLIRRKLAMVSRVRDFCRANPIDTSGYVEAMAQLEERVGRAEGLLTQQNTGVLDRARQHERQGGAAEDDSGETPPSSRAHCARCCDGEP